MFCQILRKESQTFKLSVGWASRWCFCPRLKDEKEEEFNSLNMRFCATNCIWYTEGEIVLSYDVLYADSTKPFILHTDASVEGLGVVLYQKHDGFEKIVAYGSRGLYKAKGNYPAHKLEFLCLKWAVTDKFLYYRYGNTFSVYTDNSPLTYVLTSAKLDVTAHRW